VPDSGTESCLVGETRECSCGVGYLGEQGCYGTWLACVCEGWPVQDLGDPCDAPCSGLDLPDGIQPVCAAGRCSFACDEPDGEALCLALGFDCDGGFCRD
jgi:hypothetical protein